MLVHGTGGAAATNFGHLAGQWGDRTVVALDLSGSGDTIDTGGRIDLDDLVAQVMGVAGQAGLDRYDVVGFSLGAVVAFEDPNGLVKTVADLLADVDA